MKIPRRIYADLYGPTTGDRVRLADTDLIVEVERDYTVYGDEITFGGGKVIRDGMGQSSTAIRETEHGALDLVITTDTSIAHLAGAMAMPVWILLPHLSDWRWMQQTETTPWYPSARLFRQSAPGNWDEVIKRVIKQIRELRTAGRRPAALLIQQESQPFRLIPA